MSKCFKQLRKRVILGLLVLSMAIGVLAGCSGSDSAAKTVSLHGAWGGAHVEGGTATSAQLSGTIVHETGSKDFSGSMTINEEEYTLKGTIENKVIQIIMSNPQSSITWNGEYIDGRMKGSYTRSANATNKAVSDAATVAPTTGTFSVMQYLNIQGNIKMGPWLLYSQDNTKSQGNMTIRIGFSDDIITANTTVTGTDPATGTTINYGTFPMVKTVKIDGYILYEYTFQQLPSNALFSYVININDPSVKNPYSINATFRTPPSWADIDSGKVTSQVFFGMGDNRREYGTASDNLPMVENNMIQYGGISSDVTAQSCIIHCGDAVSLGKNIDYFAPAVFRSYGWGIEWLKSSNDTAKTDTYKHDLRPHTWMRASMPTFMAPGNHEGYSNLPSMALGTGKGDLDFYGVLMTRIPAADQIMLTNGEVSWTYMADYGGMRVISLNAYYCFNQTDLDAITNKLTTWVNGAYPGGPIILVVHPSPYGSGYAPEHENGGFYFSNMPNLQTYLKKLFVGKKNVIVISGHEHETARALQDGINYYVLGTGGAADMNYGGLKDNKYDIDSFVKLSNYTGPSTFNKVSDPNFQNVYMDFAFAKFTVDYKAKQITTVIYGAKDGDNGKIIDVNIWNY
jgi:hypothetical protein